MPNKPCGDRIILFLSPTIQMFSKMNGKTIAIGDIHGCIKALNTILEAINPQPEDVIIPLGDLVDRGPDSKGVVQTLLDLSDICELRPVLGNHEEMFLDVVQGRSPADSWLQYGGKETLMSYGYEGDYGVIPGDHLEFLESFNDYIELESHILVHANYLPDTELSEQPIRMLRWTSLHQFTPGRHLSGKTAICGHTPDHGGEVMAVGHLKCIDTYCHGGGWLTAMNIENGEIWQANDEGVLREW